MPSWTAKFYGIIDIIAGILVFMYAPIPDVLKIFILAVMLIKGIPSLFA